MPRTESHHPQYDYENDVVPPPDSRSLRSKIGDTRQRAKHYFQADINAPRQEASDPEKALTTRRSKDSEEFLPGIEQRAMEGTKKAGEGVRIRKAVKAEEKLPPPPVVVAKKAPLAEAKPRLAAVSEARVLPGRFDRAAKIPFDYSASKTQLENYLKTFVSFARKAKDLPGISRESEGNLRTYCREAIESIGRESRTVAFERYYAELRKLLAVSGVNLEEYERKVTKDSSPAKLSKAA